MTFSPWILIFSTFFGMLAAYFAQNRGKNPYLWFSLGFLFGIFGIVAFFIPLRSKRPAPKTKPPKPQPYIDGPRNCFWYYLDEQQQRKGPMSFQAFSRAWKQGELSPSTFIWHEQLSEWKPLQELIRMREFS